ncbi:hypothetical protein FGF1_11890 [Flavobacteriaceae bacterium GF1]
MLVYLLKSAACMVILFLFYKLFLERENMHVFKRFFLTGSLVVSLLIPLLVFTEYVEAIPRGTNATIDADSPIFHNQGISDMAMVNWEMLLWNLYSVGCLVVGFRFAKHLFQIVRRIQKNPKHKVNFSTRVLLNEKMPPHTFLNYIFLNKKEFENGTIPKEVILHEETHARQWHSLDVLFIELLHIVLWFNPLLFLFKKSIKLNHEFLADSAVLKERVGTKKYQNTLLSYLSGESERNNQSIHMANAINYSSIKKRFTVMGKQTSKTSAVLRTLIVVPLTLILLFGFSEKKMVQNKIPQTNTLGVHTLGKQPFVLAIDNSRIVLNGTELALHAFSGAVNELTKDWEETDYASIVPSVHFNNTPNSFLEKVEVEFQKTHFSKANEGMQIFPDKTTNNIVQKGASREQMKEYEALAKKYNTMPRDNMHILTKEVERMKYLYSLMSDKQRADTEPFPNFPEPPQPPGPTSGIGEVPPPPPPVKAPNMKEVREVPPPPAPKSPLEHIKEVAEKGAIFYYEGKRIPSEKAMALFQSSEALNLVTNHTNDGDYIVHISTEPIVIKK